MDLPVTSPKIRWHLVAIVAGVAVWALALGFALYLNFGPERGRPSRAQAIAAERKHAEQRERLDERAQWQALVRRAERGHVDAMLEVADDYAEGSEGAPHDETKAFEWLLRAAKANSVEAMVAVAERYENGQGTPKNLPRAIEWYQRAANAGETSAARWLGDLYFRGEKVPRDDEAALRWYRKCAEMGDNLARKRIAEMHESGRGTPRDLTAAFFDFARVAEVGDAEAQNKVGWMLAFGIGVAADPAEAVKWFQRAADQDNMLAVTNLGAAYVLGQGVERNEAEGRRLLQRAIDAGEPYAMLRVADFHFRGVGGFAHDAKSAVALLRRAVELKSDEAGVILARLYLEGNTVPKDEVRAFNDLKEIARRGSIAAKTELARLYLQGVPGVPADWPKARSLAKAGADEGYAPAMTLYALLLRNGIGGDRDQAAASAQLQAAADQHDQTAARLLRELPKPARVSERSDERNAERASPMPQSPLDAPKESGRPDDLTQAIRLLRSLQGVAQTSPPTAAREEEAPLPSERQPIPVYRVPPAYPYDLRMLGITGVVTIDFIIDRDGTPVNVYAAESTVAGFEDAAIAAVAKWKFKPGIKDGKPVATHMQAPIVFTLNDEAPETAKAEAEEKAK